MVYYRLMVSDRNMQVYLRLGYVADVHLVPKQIHFKVEIGSRLAVSRLNSLTEWAQVTWHESVGTINVQHILHSIKSYYV